MSCLVCGKDVPSSHDCQGIHDDCWNEAERRIKAYTDLKKVPGCEHKNKTHEIEHTDISWCPKGCEGVTTDLVVSCKDCGATIYEIHEGHEGCKHGRN